MATYRIKIVGVHYAVNTDNTRPAPETEDMHIRTTERLKELDALRPDVVLMPEPSNPVDARAVMARAKGKRIGYVDKTQLDTVHALLQAGGGSFLRTRISEVEARKHGWLHVTLEADAEVPVEPSQSHSDEWNGWTSTLPSIAPDEAHFARIEAEAILDGVFSKHIADDSVKHGLVEDLDLVEENIRLWLDSALHDLSEEARLTREHYILSLKELTARNVTPGQELTSGNTTPGQDMGLQNTVSSQPMPRIKALVTALEKQRTAICGNRRMHLRIDGWWKELMQSDGMDIFWKTWMARTGGDPGQGMDEILTPLKALPYDLYAVIDDKGLFFSRLHYNHVPRKVFWQIVSLMLLRERTFTEDWGNETDPQREQGGSKTEHPSEGCRKTQYPSDKPDEPFIVTIPEELQSPEAQKVLVKLQKKGLLDEDLQPSTLKGWQKGTLAYELAGRFGIKHVWVEMAKMWKCNAKTLRQYYSKEFAEPKAVEFSKNVKSIIY